MIDIYKKLRFNMYASIYIQLYETNEFDDKDNILHRDNFTNNFNNSCKIVVEANTLKDEIH
jgi:hypothetical protein